MVAPAPEPSDETWRLGAVDLAARLRSGAMSAREAVTAQLRRIEAVNPGLNAIVDLLAARALAEADALDARWARGEPPGPLHGVPITVKANIEVDGSATTHGVPASRDAVATEDAPHIARLRAAGAIVIGRTNLPDYGLRMHTESTLYGATLNPWDATRTSGGSSGGDAVAVATGMTALGIGNDLGGSLRLPAQYCGVLSLRPSLGRIASGSRSGPPPPLSRQLFSVQGPLARHTADLRLALDVMAGPDPRDPRAVPAPLDWPPDPGLPRVALTLDPGGLGVDPSIALGIERAADALRDAGYRVEEADPPSVPEAARLWALLVYTELRPDLPALRQIAAADALRYTDLTLDLDPPASIEEYIAGWSRRFQLQREWATFLERYPLIIGPVSTLLPFPVGDDNAGAAQAAAVRRSLRLTLAVSLLGLPAVAVPAGLTPPSEPRQSPLPLGVQIIAGPFREDRCLEAAGAIAQRLGVPRPPGG